AATPAQYKELANSLELPDRPMPLSKFERAVPGEAILIGRMARIAAHAVISNYCAMKISDCFANAMRDQHAKSHGCVKAEFIVRDDLPAEFTTSLFRPGARYPAIVRFSNGNGRPRSDRKIDARGMAIKLRGVESSTLLRTLAPDRARAGEHDFVLSSFPVFFCRDVVDYSELMNLVSAPHGTWREWLDLIKRVLEFGVRNPRQSVMFLLTGVVSLATIRNPLIATYHSMSPYLFGDDKVVRYVVRPERRRNNFARSWTFPTWPRSRSFLRDALVSDLDPAMHRPGDDFAFDFSVRVRHAASPNDAEDASRWWIAPRDRTVRLGSIEIPRQNFLTPDQLYECEHMTFNPWNCLEQHRPLGSINRMRLAVYLASLQVRQKLNMVAS
ncbi:MAG TPA: catalase, partial [Gemmatimonadaceae bacterium]|nr:catalase [Gemmatimonadaceae bacterium]